MKTKPATSNSSGGLNSNSSKSGTRKSSHSRDRDKKRSGPSGESGASSQCDTPPLNEKDSPSHGKYAGISPQSVQCMSEQVLAEQLSPEASAGLAEDVSYKLRELIHNIALHAHHTKSPRVNVDDVNTVLRLMDTEPVLAPQPAQWQPLGDLCTTVDPMVDVLSVAVEQQPCLTVPAPSLSTAWITDNKNLSGSEHISSTLHNYYNKISRAVFSNNKRLVRAALNDLSTNTHIGPIVPNLISLSILVLNDESIAVMASLTHQTLHNQALNVLEALLINPCCQDTDVTLQLQRLFPLLVSNVLTESLLSEQMCRIMLAVVTVWPQLAHIGRNIILDYLSQGVRERLSAPLVTCLASLGRKTLRDGLMPHLDMIESFISGENVDNLFCPGLYEAILNSSHVLLGPKMKYEPELALIDQILYEMLGDALIPRRIHYLCPEKIEEPPPIGKPDYDSAPFSPPKAFKRKSKVRVIHHFPVKSERNGLFYDCAFDVPPNALSQCKSLFTPCIRFNFAGCRQLQVQNTRNPSIRTPYANVYPNGNRDLLDRKVNIVVANGLLNRFRYKLPGNKKPAPLLSCYTL